MRWWLGNIDSTIKKNTQNSSNKTITEIFYKVQVEGLNNTSVLDPFKDWSEEIKTFLEDPT